MDELVAASQARAEELGLTADSRVLSTVDWTIPVGVTDALLATLAAGASLVQISNADPAKLDRHRASERITVDLG